MAAVDIMMYFPIMVLFIELIVVGGRVASTQADVQSAAREAARQASLANDFGTASARANDVGLGALEDKGYRCESPSVSLGGNFEAGGIVKVEVRCTVRLNDLGFLPVPGSHTVVRTALEPIDTYRVVR